MSRSARPLLLDTHVWIWLVNGDEQLSAGIRSAIDEAASHDRVWVSAISMWEVGMLEAKGRLRLTRDCLAWVREALAKPGLTLVPLSPSVAVGSSRLPGEFHGDPADRILVATARELRATLVTSDGPILRYAAAGHVLALTA